MPRPCVVLILAIATNGCGVSILGSYAADTPFLRAHNELAERERVVGPPQTDARYTLASAPLRVVCQTQTSSPTQQEDVAYFDGAQRAFVGFMAVSEVVMGAFMLREAVDTGGAGFWVGGGALQADALGALAFAIFAPTKSTTSIRRGRTLPQRHGTCPAGLSVVTAGRALPVDPGGRIPGGVGALIVDFGASVTFGGRTAAWFPSPQDKCALARESRHPNASAICGVTPPGALPQPPPPAGPNGLGWPAGLQWNGSIGFP